MDNTRLINYLSSNISPINYIDEYHSKKLPVSILFYKVCNSFPKDKIGSMKSAFKHIQNEKFKIYQTILNENEISLIIKNQNSLRPKVGQYIEFLVLSYLQTCLEQPELLKLSSAQEDISEGWDFIYREQKYDITTNPNKISRSGVKLIFIAQDKVLDQDNLMLDNALNYVNSMLKDEFNINNAKADFTNTIVNKVRSKYIELFNHKVKYIIPTVPTLIEKEDKSDLQVPEYEGISLPTKTIGTKLENLSLETVAIAQKIEQLSPLEKQQIDIIIQTMINSKQ